MVGSRVRFNALKWYFIEAIKSFMTILESKPEDANPLLLGVRQ